MCQTNARDNFVQMGGGDDRATADEAIENALAEENEREEIIQSCRWSVPQALFLHDTPQEQYDEWAQRQQSVFTDCLRENGIEEDIEYRESPDMERQREQDQDVAPLAEQAEELAEEEAPVDGTAEERIAALEERVAELTELIRELTEALQPN
jgi:hypothetical protein